MEKMLAGTSKMAIRFRTSCQPALPRVGHYCKPRQKARSIAGFCELGSEHILKSSQRPLTYRLQAVDLLAKIHRANFKLECQFFHATYVLKLLDLQLSF